MVPTPWLNYGESCSHDRMWEKTTNWLLPITTCTHREIFSVVLKNARMISVFHSSPPHSHPLCYYYDYCVTSQSVIHKHFFRQHRKRDLPKNIRLRPAGMMILVGYRFGLTILATLTISFDTLVLTFSLSFPSASIPYIKKYDYWARRCKKQSLIPTEIIYTTQ